MPGWKDKFTTADHNAVNQAIREAESKTSAEIVPVIASSSGRYDRSEDTIGVWFSLILLSIVWYMMPIPEIELGSWESSHPWNYLFVLLITVLFGFIIGTVIGNYVDFLRRIFTPKRQMRDEVRQRAQAVFFDSRVHHTAGGHGILLYVSLFERMAAVFADRDVVRKLGQATLDKLCQQFSDRLRRESPTQALCETAREVGDLLAPLLPRAADDVNELPDTLRLLD